jgi:acetate kinase
MGKRHEAKGKNHLLLDCQLMRSTLTSVRREGRHILVINSGSSSLKFSLLDVKSEAVIASGIAERLGTAEAFLKFSAESSACFVIPTNEELMIARQTTALALQGQNRTTNDK